MVEFTLFNKTKRPVGASSELLMSESFSCSFKRFVQMADPSDVYAWANATLTSFKTLNHSAINRLVALRCAVI